VNKTFSSSFLISERDETVQLKIRGLKLSDQLLSEIKDEHCLEKIRARRKNILNLVAYNLDFIQNRVLRVKTDSVDLELFSYFIDYLKREGMANFSYSDARHLTELKDTSGTTAIRDFIATVKAYHGTLTAEGNLLLSMDE
jgi:hypothetical protein